MIDKALEPAESTSYLHDFIDFSLALDRLDGGALVRGGGPGETDEKMRPFLRGADELAAVTGDRVFGDARFNPDGTLDILKWSRPQFDGPALRAATIMRCMNLLEKDGTQRLEPARELVFKDLGFLFRHFREPCYDLWEARFGHHYHTRLVTLAALKAGSQWAVGQGEPRKAAAYKSAAAILEGELDHHWSQRNGFYLAAIKSPHAGDNDFDLDSAVLLAVVDSRNGGRRHSILDPRMQATVLRLQQLFAEELPINHTQQETDPKQGVLFGRLKGDTYHGGGAFNTITLAAAEFYYSLAGAVARGIDIPVTSENRAFLENCGIHIEPAELAHRAPLPRDEGKRAELVHALHAQGEAIMNAFRRFVPGSGELAEQMDKETGAPLSAKNLAWSCAAFVRAFTARISVTT